MAIQFARIELMGRATGGNACCKGAYNARTKIKDQQTNIIYNFQKRGDNIYHEILLPEGVDQKFKDTKILMNEVERVETRKNSSLLKDIVIALPDDKELNLQDRINISHLVIDKMEWVKEGLGVQLDIHEPHNGETNWHAHILLTKRRFAGCGTKLGAKARDLDIQVRGGKNPFGIPEEQMIHEKVRDTINDYFKELGLENRVDEIGVIPQEHIGPMRMRSILNEAVIRNEARQVANIESLKDGEDVLDRITRNVSVFSKKDLLRVVKCVPDKERAGALVEAAVSSDRIVPLYHDNGSSVDLYSTREVRFEEEKLMRLGGYIGRNKNLIVNSFDSAASRINNIISEDQFLNDQQRGALSHLLLADSGIRILKGRAGTGKSYVLGRIVAISKFCGVEVIGLAPTHKANLELKKVGYEKSDTVKGFLFKLHNGRVELSKNSLIVVDEAGMVGNDDYSELLRVVAAKKCNVILAGDEKQLLSIQRGGMFEEFADKFGSFELSDIRRQEVEWGREVALAFSEGNVREGINVLVANGRLVRKDNKINSMESLLTDWNNSRELLENKLIIAVKNSDVDILNKGARELLRKKGVLSDLEWHVSKKGINFDEKVEDAGFMKGDRVVFKETSKDLGINNGDFGQLTYVSYKEFRVKLDRGEEIVFNPNEFSSFKHGYASTVYKAQGASIRDVYVLHDGFSTNRNSYVAMSRHVKDLHLYTNFNTTKNDEQLIRQLSFNADNSASISYWTREELELAEWQHKERSKGLLAKIGNKISDFAKEKITNFIDKNKINSDYYIFEKPEILSSKVEEVLELVYEYKVTTDSQGHIISKGVELEEQEKAVVGGYNTRASSNMQTQENTAKTSHKLDNVPRVKQRKSAKERFYANREYQQSEESNNRGKDRIKNRDENRIKNEADYRQETEQLRTEVKWGAEKIAKSFLGEPNKHLSNKTTLRYGENGKLAIRISGEKAGNWYDFSESKGGDLFDLVQDKQGCDFKEVVSYLRDTLGIHTTNHLRLVYDHEARNNYVDHYKQVNAEKAVEVAKIRKAENLYNRSVNIEKDTVPYRYLSETRGIDCDFGSDVKTCLIFDKSLNKKLPAIVAFARDTSGNITGGQQVLLAPKFGQKADIPVPKKSFGKIAGSFVEVASKEAASLKNKQDENLKNKCKITIIAEGLETALSIKQAGIEAKILCSLGISNIKNYIPEKGEKIERIIIAADNDGENSITGKTIIEAKNALAKHAMVIIVKPSEVGDFNDILQKQGGIVGTKEIREIFEPVINSFKLYNDQEAKIIVNYEQFKGEKTDIDEFFVQNRHLLDNLVTFNPNYDIAKLKNKLENLGDLTKLELLKDTYSKEFSSSVAKINEQIDLELANVDIVKLKLSAKKINIDDLRTQVTTYAIDRWQAQNYILLSDKQVKALVSRSLFELNNKERIISALNGRWFIENPGEIKPLSYKIKCERVGEKVTKVSGYLVEKKVLDSLDMHLQIKKDDNIIREAINLSKTRKAKLDEVLEHDRQIHELSSLGLSNKVQKSVAEQLVDYKLQYGIGMDANVTTEKLELMKTAAELEQKLLPNITDKFKHELHEGFVEGKVSDLQQKADISENIDLAVHRLRTEIHDQMHNLHTNSLDHSFIVSGSGHNNEHYATVIQKTVIQAKEFQEDVNMRRDQYEEEHEQMHQNGMSIGMNM